MAGDNLVGIAVGCSLAAVLAAAALVFLTAWCVSRCRKKQTAKTYARIPVMDDIEAPNKKGNWSLFALPSPEKNIKTELVQPDASIPNTKINQQLGFQKETLVTDGSLHIGTIDAEVSPYHSLLLNNDKLESVENDLLRPAGEDRGLGHLVYGIKYDLENLNLEVRVVKAQNLLAKDTNGSSDPYVKAIITPGSKKYFLESKVKMKTLNPVWKETFYFEGFSMAKLANKTLVLQVLDFDRLSKDDPIGEVEIPFSSLNLYAPAMYCSYLSPCQGNRSGLGELLVSLCYHSTAGKLKVVIGKARNLKAKDLLGSSDPYVKVWLIYQGNKIEKRKTAVKMKCLNPTYDETFEFAVPLDHVKETSVHIYVMDYDKWSQNELIGELLLCAKSGDAERKLWNGMLSKPKQLVSNWMVLRRMKSKR